jgi:hypothetical protein
MVNICCNILLHPLAIDEQMISTPGKRFYPMFAVKLWGPPAGRRFFQCQLVAASRRIAIRFAVAESLAET